MTRRSTNSKHGHQGTRPVASTKGLPELVLPASLTQSLAAGHPWIYRDHIPRGFEAETGSWVRVKAGGWEAYALWDAESAIALRVFSTQQVPDASWIRARVRAAWEGRGILRQQGTDAYRCIFGEADGLPGITVDVYGRFAVVLTYSSSVAELLGPVTEALVEVGGFAGVVRRTSSDGEGAGSSVQLEALFGRLPPQRFVVEENGIRLNAELYHGQKTGLFLDHRDNRQWVRSLAEGRSVLNLFSYTGAFSVSAALGGALSTTNVDSAAGAIEAAKGNFRLNGLDPDAHHFVTADAFEFLEGAVRRGETWDLVICDPPSFARSAKHRKAALRAYTRLSALGFRVTSQSGLYAAASCTSQVSPTEFLGILADAGRPARRSFQVLREVGQPLDHPQLAAHPEGRYLKFVMGRVRERV